MIQTQLIQLGIQWTSSQYVHREHSFADHSHVAHSHSLICPKCETTWARLVFLNSEDSFVWPESQFCERCNIKDSWHPVPGSLFIEEGWGVIDDSLLDVLPQTLLIREFHLTLKAYET